MTVRLHPEHDADRALSERLASRTATVAVIGLGYVGLPLLAAVVRAGFPAIGLDHDQSKIDSLQAGRSYLPHLGPQVMSDLGSAASLTLSSDPAVLKAAEVVLLCVPTPLRPDRTPDLSAVERAGRDVARWMSPFVTSSRSSMVVLESTTYPGTTREFLAPLVHAGCEQSERLHVAFSPEREDPGNRQYTTSTIPKLVGGLDEVGTDLAQIFYDQIVQETVRVESAEVAEAAKLVENIYRAVNIALVNELKVILNAMDLDIWQVLDAASTKPFGFHRFNPGPGFGGHCVPIDPFYLTWRARQVGMDSRFIELAGEINRHMPEYVVERCRRALPGRREGLRGAGVLVLGMAYKPNIGDVRESPSFEIIELLQAEGADVAYHDPHVPRTWKGRHHDLQMQSIEWDPEQLGRYDLVLIATDHDWYDWTVIGQHARAIVDTRNAMARAKELPKAQVIKA